MNRIVCRTCLTKIIDGNYVIFNKEDKISVQIEIDLQFCVPEMNLNLIESPVFCISCVHALREACDFKNRCLRTEKQILSFMDDMEIESKKVNLIDIYNDSNDLISVNSNYHVDYYLGETELLEPESQITVVKCEVVTDCTKEFASGTNFTSDIQNCVKHFKQEITYEEYNYLNDFDNDLNKVHFQLNDNCQISSAAHKRIDNKVAPICTTEGNRHKSLKSNKRSFICTICNFSTDFKNHLKIHAKGHRPDSFLCNCCKYSTLYKRRLEMHIIQVHKNVNMEVSTKPRIYSGKFVCNICQYSTKYKHCLKQHMYTHTGEKPFSCHFCNYNSAYKNYLKVHLFNHEILK